MDSRCSITRHSMKHGYIGNRWFWAIIMLTCVLHFFDCLTTYVAISYHGCEEDNPIMAYVLKEYGWNVLFLSKAIGVFLIMFITCYIKFRSKRRDWHVGVEISSVISFIIMTYVVLSNYAKTIE